MTGVKLSIEDRRFLPGCSAGLAEKTAIVELSVKGRVTPNLLVEKRIRARAAALSPGDPFYRVTDRDWPTAFLVPGSEPRAPGREGLRWLGDWVAALTVAIQRWGRDPVWRGRVCSVERGRLRLAIPWFRQSFFDESLSAALQMIPEWLQPEQAAPEGNPAWLGWLKAGGTPVSELERYFGGRWADIQAGGLVPVMLRFLEAAVRRGMPFEVLHGFTQIGWGANAERFDQSLTGRTGWLGVAIARNKFKAIQTMADANLPTPRTGLLANAEQARQLADELGWPVVVKPVDQDGGVGVVTGIRDPAQLMRAFEQAERFSPGRVLVEQQCPGDDHRILVVAGEVLQVVRRIPARVVGDGVHTVRQLIEQINRDPRRGSRYHSLLQTVVIGADEVEFLAEQGLDADSVPPAGRCVWVGRIANIGAGGTAEDVSAIAHPDNVALAARAARVLELNIAGVDFLCPDISRSWLEVGGAICEVNAQPGFRPHWLADPARDIHGEVLDALFGGRPARIPTAAITGTNGKSTTSEMLCRIWTEAGRLTGVCTTARVRIGDQIVSTDNLSGQPGARIILNDPAVQAAVLEMPRKGLIYFGHHCDRYDVAAMLNVQRDHLGVDGIETIEQMAELKAEVLERATEAVVVNAEDPLCLAMRARAGTDRHILVARTPAAPAVSEHRIQGGEAVFIDSRHGVPWIVLATGESETPVMPVHDIPATMNGLLAFNESNAMFAAALAWAQGIEIGAIRQALSTFENSAEQNPGRYNFTKGLAFDVLVDFAHNPDGVRGLCSVIRSLPVAGRRLLCSLNFGSRHPEFVNEMAPGLSATFDEFVLGCDPVEVRACPAYAGDDPVATMVSRYRALLLEQGVGPEAITCEGDRLAAIRTALELARPGDLVVVLSDHDEAQRVLEQWQADGARLIDGKP